MTIVLIQSNAQRITLADESVHCVVTSPPYWGLRKYSGDMAKIWGGDPGCVHEWGDKYFGDRRAHGAGEKKWLTQFIDGKIPEHIKVSQGQFCILCGAWYGELGLEPTPEQYVENMVAVFREVRRVLRSDGSVWLNLGDSYNGSGGAGGDYNEGGLKEGQPRYPGRKVGTLKPKDLCGIPWRVAFALQADGWWLRSDIIWSKPNPMPESVTDRPTKAHEYLFLLTKSAKYFYDCDAVREDSIDPESYRGRRKRNADQFTQQGIKAEYREGFAKLDGQKYPRRNRRTVWHIATAPFSGAHFATYPPALVEPCIKAGTSERGVCPECGTPWKRITEKGEPIINAWSMKGPGNYNFETKEPDPIDWDGGSTLKHSRTHTTLGWKPVCSCWKDLPDPNAPRTKNARKKHQQDMGNYWKFRAVCRFGKTEEAIILDPFIGSGTTLQVARALDRSGIGIDLSMEYLHLAKRRLSLDIWNTWEKGIGKKDNTDVAELPLFKEKL